MSVSENENQIKQVLTALEDPGQPGSKMVVFRYRKPELQRKRAIIPFCKSDIITAGVQVIREGGETNMHSHAAMDGFWFVLKGKARFYGEGDRLEAELGPMEGVFVPRNTQYWFESSGSEELELLQVEAMVKGIPNTRTDHRAKRVDAPLAELFRPDGGDYFAKETEK